MNSSQDKDAIQKREVELQERERMIRLREMELELTQQRQTHDLSDPLQPTTKMARPEPTLRRWRRKAIIVAQLMGLAVIAVASIKIGTWVAMAIVVGGVGWLGYKAFFEDSPRE
jgi:Flp pilus assembly protein TadB